MSVDLQGTAQIQGGKPNIGAWLQVSESPQRNKLGEAQNGKRGDRIRRISVNNFSQEIKLWEERGSEQRKLRQKTQETYEDNKTQSSFRSVKERLLNQRMQKLNYQSMDCKQDDSETEEEIEGLSYQTFKMIKKRERNELTSTMVQSTCKMSESNFRRSTTHK